MHGVSEIPRGGQRIGKAPGAQKNKTKTERIADMFSENERITMRQIFRLFLFDFLGISTLILPSVLAAETSVYGGVSILAAGVMGTGYLAYLIRCRKRLGTDLATFLSDGPADAPKERGEDAASPVANLIKSTGKLAGGISDFIKRTFGILLALLHTAAAGFTAAVTAEMIRKSLIREESYALILLLLLAAASYAIAGDISSRARVYEILFWFVAAPLVILPQKKSICRIMCRGSPPVRRQLQRVLMPYLDVSVQCLRSCSFRRKTGLIRRKYGRSVRFLVPYAARFMRPL
jgi:hypothetical protein